MIGVPVEERGRLMSTVMVIMEENDRSTWGGVG